MKDKSTGITYEVMHHTAMEYHDLSYVLCILGRGLVYTTSYVGLCVILLETLPNAQVGMVTTGRTK